MCEQDTAVSTAQQGEVEYRDVPGFPGYRVGDDGSVWSCRRPGAGSKTFGAWRRLRHSFTDNGRFIVGLHRESRRHRKQVHALVMLAFVGPYPAGLEVCHENGDHTDNRLSNLRYDTHKGNEADKERHGRRVRGDRHPLARLDADGARAARVLLAEGRSLSYVAEQLGVSKKTIVNIKKGRVWAWVK